MDVKSFLLSKWLPQTFNHDRENTMKKPQQIYDQEIPDDDYKMAWGMERDKANVESTKKWLYIGADSRNPGYAKVGMTMGDMSTRSTSTASPPYYLFCAFQLRHDIKKEQLKNIENGAFAYLDGVFPGRREKHRETQRLSECYYDIDFEDFFCHLHDYLYNNHHNHFLITGFDNGFGDVEGSALAWHFNDLVSLQDRRRFIYMILQ